MAKRKTKTNKQEAEGSVRMSVSFDQDDYAELKAIAESKRVSIAWVVRDAVVDYLTARHRPGARRQAAPVQRTYRVKT